MPSSDVRLRGAQRLLAARPGPRNALAVGSGITLLSAAALLCLGHILAEDGRKMSKHLGNILEPIALMDDQAAKLTSAGLRVARIHSNLSRDDARTARLKAKPFAANWRATAITASVPARGRTRPHGSAAGFSLPGGSILSSALL